MRNSELTKGNKKCLEAILTYMKEHGYAPSIRELQDMTGYKSTSSVALNVGRLFDLGYIETEAPIGSPRAYRLGKRTYEEGLTKR